MKTNSEMNKKDLALARHAIELGISVKELLEIIKRKADCGPTAWTQDDSSTCLRVSKNRSE
jgi:hypothetical protein